MSHLLQYLGIEKDPEPIPVIHPPTPKPVIQRNGKVVGAFARWYREHGMSWGGLKRGFEGEAIEVESLSEEGKRLAGILGACNTLQRRKLRGFVRSAVGASRDEVRR